MMTIEQIKKGLRNRRMEMVAKETGLHVNTVTYIRDGLSKNPVYSTLKALSDYLEGSSGKDSEGG
jgi:hypothetical protein